LLLLLLWLMLGLRNLKRLAASAPVALIIFHDAACVQLHIWVYACPQRQQLQAGKEALASSSSSSRKSRATSTADSETAASVVHYKFISEPCR
jgi:hypothetical protein